jgi:hypothetical protein
MVGLKQLEQQLDFLMSKSMSDDADRQGGDYIIRAIYDKTLKFKEKLRETFPDEFEFAPYPYNTIKDQCNETKNVRIQRPDYDWKEQFFNPYSLSLFFKKTDPFECNLILQLDTFVLVRYSPERFYLREWEYGVVKDDTVMSSGQCLQIIRDKGWIEHYPGTWLDKNQYYYHVKLLKNTFILQLQLEYGKKTRRVLILEGKHSVG